MIDVVVLAAGSSTRFGSDKLVADVDGRPLLAVTLDLVCSEVAPERVMVVVAPGDEARTGISKSRGVRCVVARDAARGMRWSIHAGLDSAAVDSSGVVVLLADDPFAAHELAPVLMAAAVQPDRIVAIGRADGAPHPVYVPRAEWPDPPTCDDDHGLRGLIGDHAIVLEPTSAVDPCDVDVPSDLQELRALVDG